MISTYEIIVSNPKKDKARTRNVFRRGTTRIVAHVVEPNGKGLGYQGIVKRVNAAPYITEVFDKLKDCKSKVAEKL